MARPSKRKPVEKSRVVGAKTKTKAYSLTHEFSVAAEPEVSYNTRIRDIGNSKGIILNNVILETAGLQAETKIVIHASKGIIQIMKVKQDDINTDLSTWNKQFKAAFKKGFKPEKDLFEGMQNDFDSKEW
jgi:antitoxin component of MazEF toxin-antitoxin module